MEVVNTEMRKLIAQGYKHFFLDEATYLGGFLNMSAEWPDLTVPANKIKIIVSGADSFLLWTATVTSLFHRYQRFSTNWLSCSEYQKVFDGSYDQYKQCGGVFTNEKMGLYIQSSVVDNLLHTIEHLIDDANRTNFYTDILYGISSKVIFEAVINILKCAIEEIVIENYAEKLSQMNIADLGSVIGILEVKKNKVRDLKVRIAESVPIYRNFTNIDDPVEVIEALIEFLVKIGCLFESTTAMTDLGRQRKTYCFSHNALMNFAVEETIQDITNINENNKPELAEVVREAADCAMDENIVLAHVLSTISEGEKVFKYRDVEGREIDIVVINRNAEILRLIEVKSKTKIDEVQVINGEASHLYDDTIMQNIGINETFKISRTIVYRGHTFDIYNEKGDLKLWNIEEFLCQ
jgi:predicted AAA+ superfamily ATPase